MAFSGYLYNSANIQPFSGHLGLPELRCPDLDAIGTPFEYFNASQSPVFGAAIPMGPWDAAAARSKLWVIEDDQRTPFGSQGAGPFGYCLTAAEYAAKARLNLLVTGIYGVGSYLDSWISAACSTPISTTRTPPPRCGEPSHRPETT